jgi:hypothetical protein
MSINPNDYSLSEFMRLTHRADKLIFSLGDLVSVDDGILRDRVPNSSCRSYKLTGEVADDLRLLYGVDEDEEVILSTRRFGSNGSVHWLAVRAGGHGQIFEDRNEHRRADNLFQSLVAWLDEQLKRKDYVDSGHAAALFDGVL